MRIHLLLIQTVIFITLVYTNSLSAIIIGIQDFGNENGNDPNQLSVSKSENDLTITAGSNASTSGWDGFGYFEGSQIGMNDTTYGQSRTIEIPSTVDLAWKFGNSGNQLLGDVKITNNGTSDFRLTHIHFDAENAYEGNIPTKIEIFYLASGSNLVKGPSQSEGTPVVDGKPFYNYQWTGPETIQVNRSIGAALEGTGWLAPGDSASFRIKWSQQISNTNIALTFIDNFAFEGEFEANNDTSEPEAEAEPLPEGYVMVGTSDFIPSNNGIDLGEMIITEGDLQLDIGPTASSLGRDGYGVETNSLVGLNDDSYGSTLAIPIPSAENSAWRFGNSGNQFLGDIKITNNGTLPLKLTHLHFDARNKFDSNHKQKLEVLYLATGSNLVKGPSAEDGEALPNLKPIYSYTWNSYKTVQVNRSIGAAIDGTAWLAPGESASFRFKWSDDQGNGLGQTQIDNIALRGIFVEPTDTTTTSESLELSISYINADNLLVNWDTSSGSNYRLETSNNPSGPYTPVSGFENFSSDTQSAFLNPSIFGPKAFFKLSKQSN